MNSLVDENEYNYNRDKFNYHIQDIKISQPNKIYKLIETIHPVTSLFIKNIHDYEFNNEINTNHVNSIYNELTNSDDPFMIGYFTIIQCDDENNKLYLLDGHHRKQALLRIMEYNKDSIYIDKIYIEIKLYHVSKKDCKQVEELYNKINNVKPYMIKTNEDIIRNIISRLSKITSFKNGLHSYKNNDTDGNFPYYNINKFTNILRTKLKDREDSDNVNEDVIVDKILEFNEICENLNIYELFNIDISTYNNKKFMYDKKLSKLRNVGFYLRTAPYNNKWYDTL